MKKLLIGFGIVIALVVVVVGGGIAYLMTVNVEDYKPQIEAKAKEALGRDVKLNGRIKLAIWPNIGLDVADVRVANVQGGQAKELATLKSLTVSVKLMPLLSRSLEIDSFVLNEPTINAEIDKAGKPNWVFGPPAAAKPGQPPAAGGGMPQGSVKLGDVRLVDGTLSFANLQTNEKYLLEKVNAKVGLKDMDSPLSVSGSAVWNKEKIDLTLNSGPPAKMMAGTRTPIETKLASKYVNFDFKGQCEMKDKMAGAGDISLDVPSIKDLAAWTGKPLQNVQPNTMGKLSIKGKVALAGKKFDFTDAKIGVDAINATGALSVDSTPAKPQVKGTLDIDKLDVTPYLGPEQPAKPAPAGQAGGGEWSDAPIDVSALKTFDADLQASAGQFIMRKIKTGKATVKVVVKDARATMALAVPKPGLYQGEGTVDVVVNAAGSPTAYEVKAKMAGLSAEQYLKDAQDMDKLSGTLNIDENLTMRGNSQKQIVSTVAGNGAIKFTDGAIKGIDLGGVARQLGEVGKGGGTFDPSRMMSGFKNLFGGGGASEKTDFSELSGTFTAANGVLTNNDLSLKSPFVRVTGKGTVSLPPKTMDYTVNIAAVGSASGQGGGDAAGAGIPVQCKGPWSGDSCKPNLAGMFMGDPSKLMKGGLPGLGGAGGLPGAGGAGKAIPGGMSIPGMGGGATGTQQAPTQQAPAQKPPMGGLPGGFKLPGQ